MTCPRCRHDNEAGAKFCEECAAPLERTCGNCSRELSSTAKFCPECAHPTGVVLQALTAPRFASPGNYTPKHLAEKILTSKSALEGERKQVTVLFADLKGSMELLAHRDPEEARKLLDPVLERMMEAVHRYEGTVNQVMGDGIMALFGAPLAHEDHAVRACYAALRMQESVEQYAQDVLHSHSVPIQIRVGLNSGEVVVRAIGSDLQMDYTAVGQTTHLAARMEQMATPGTILLAPATMQLVEDHMQVESTGPVAVKGMTDPVELYTLTGAGAQRGRLHAAAARGLLTRFVGRDTEIEQIRRALNLANNGRGQLVSIVGDPGLGKSRLVYEFTHSHQTQDWLVLEVAAISYSMASYLPVIALLKAYFEVHDRETHSVIREKVAGKLVALDRNLESILPPLMALLDVPVEDAHWQALDPAQRRQRTFDAVKILLLRESQKQPVLVVFEDLHWIDAETQAVLDVLVESLPTARFLLLVNYRPEYQHGWASKTYYMQVRLDAFPPESTSQLLSAILGDDPALDSLKRLLVTRGGNPFFIEESIRTLVETDALSGERGDYRPTRSIQGLEVPATVQVILAARMDRLPAEEKQLLETASVIGMDVPSVLLHEVADVSQETVQLGLAHLQAAEFLYETRLFPEHEYTFKNALTHEVAYGTLLQDRRKALHARIVGAIERTYPDRLIEHVERLASNALRGELWEKAVVYLRQAGAKAFARSANREAVAYFGQALEAVGNLPESRQKREQAVDLRLDLRHPLIPLGEFSAMFDHLCVAETLAEDLEDQGRLGWVSAYLSPYFSNTGDNDRADETARRALAIATASGDFALEVMSNFFLGLQYISRGDCRQAAHHYRRNVEALTGEWLHERFGEPGFPAVFNRAYLVWALAELGSFAEGRVHADQAMHIVEKVDQPFTLSHAYWGSGFLLLRQGDFSAAIPTLEKTLEICRESDVRLVLPWAASALGYAYALTGRLREALPLLEHAVSQSNAMKQVAYLPLWVTHLGEALLLDGRIQEAREHADQALTLARDLQQRGYEAYALRLLGEIGAHGDSSEAEVETAEASYREALVLAESLGMRPLVAHCHLGLGKLYRLTGQSEEAHEHLAIAATMYREMNMAVWLEQAGTEMRAKLS